LAEQQGDLWRIYSAAPSEAIFLCITQAATGATPEEEVEHLRCPSGIGFGVTIDPKFVERARRVD
jgi:hypothetical protein